MSNSRRQQCVGFQFRLWLNSALTRRRFSYFLWSFPLLSVHTWHKVHNITLKVSCLLLQGSEVKLNPILIAKSFKNHLWAPFQPVNSSGSEQNALWLGVFIPPKTCPWLSCRCNHHQQQLSANICLSAKSNPHNTQSTQSASAIKSWFRSWISILLSCVMSLDLAQALNYSHLIWLFFNLSNIWHCLN